MDEYILKPVDLIDSKEFFKSLIYQIDQRRVLSTKKNMFSNLLKGASEGPAMLGQKLRISSGWAGPFRADGSVNQGDFTKR